MPKTKTKKKPKKPKIQRVKVTRLNKELKEKLNKIDENIKEDFINGFYQSRLRIEIAMWEKGKAIDVFFRGVKNTISYYELEMRTGRRRANLKQWHSIYYEYPKKKDYQQIAKEKAKKWTERVYYKINAFTNSKIEQLPEDTETAKQLEASEGQPKPKKKKINQYLKQQAYNNVHFGIDQLLDILHIFRKKYELSDLRSSVLLGELRDTINKIYG